MIFVSCDYCHDELTQQGAILWSPPDKNGLSRKWHICVECYGIRKPSDPASGVPEVALSSEAPHDYSCDCRGRGWVLDDRNVPVDCPGPEFTIRMDAVS